MGSRMARSTEPGMFKRQNGYRLSGGSSIPSGAPKLYRPGVCPIGPVGFGKGRGTARGGVYQYALLDRGGTVSAIAFLDAGLLRAEYVTNVLEPSVPSSTMI